MPLWPTLGIGMLCPMHYSSTFFFIKGGRKWWIVDRNEGIRLGILLGLTSEADE